MTFRIPVEGSYCIKCGAKSKRLIELISPVTERRSGIFVCLRVKGCRTRQQSERPAKMMAVSKNRPGPSDTRECGFMGCGDQKCESVCHGVKTKPQPENSKGI